MESAFSIVEDLTENIRKYVHIKIESAKLSTAEKTSAIAANAIAGLTVVLIGMLFVLLASIAGAIALGIVLGKLWLGFLLVAIFYLLLALLIWSWRGKFIRLPLMNAIISELTKNDHEED